MLEVWRNEAPEGDDVRIIDNEDGIGLQVHWDSVSEAVEDVMARVEDPRQKRNFESLHSSHGAWGERWADYRAKEWVAHALETPDASTMEEIATMRERIVNEVPAMQTQQPRRFRRRNLDCGDDIQGERFLQRNPECWERMERTARPARIIKIAVEYSVSCSQTREELLARGAALTALAQWLVSNGYSVEIHGVWVAANFLEARQDGALSTVVVKRSNMPFDAGALATSICEIAFARKVILSGMVAHAKEYVPSGWGYPRSMTTLVAERLGYAITTPTRVNNSATAIAWLKEAVEKIAGMETSNEG